MFKCKRALHEWETLEDAEKCCNGWIRLWVPFAYGLDWLGAKSKRIDPSSKMWKPWLIEETQTEEIEKILAAMPDCFRSSTQTNPWLETEQ